MATVSHCLPSQHTHTHTHTHRLVLAASTNFPTLEIVSVRSWSLGVDCRAPNSTAMKIGRTRFGPNRVAADKREIENLFFGDF